MAYKDSVRRYRSWYAKLLRFYPKPYYERFGEGMEQTFGDLLREQSEEEKDLFGCALWMFFETFAGIIRENITFNIMKNKNIIRIIIGTICILMIPLIAMQFTDEVKWTLFDFVFAGALLLGTGFAYEFVSRKANHITYRAAVGMAVMTALLLVWVNGAVGIIGDEGNPANLLYAGVLAVGFFGALLARFRPLGMSRTLIAMAVVQMLVPVAALVIWNPQIDSWGAPGLLGVFILNAFFAGLFIGSAILFRQANAAVAKQGR